MPKKLPQKNVRVSFMIPVDIKDVVDEIADERGLPYQDLLKSYVKDGLLTEALVRDGKRIVAEDPDGSNKIVLADSVGRFVPKNVKRLLGKKEDKGEGKKNELSMRLSKNSSGRKY